ncbi:MAG: dihydropteroate synthase [Acidobacteria bacterium 13_1_20CM_4_56_7]|jgi:dihydropteroate synthase|nr:MAG: dihydropteroate synthase [Acidobacteria bacterium 13_1_20CM_4_56_7]
MRPVFTWNLGSRALELGKRTLVMGIVNVTPDSFSDGGEHLAPDAAVAHALKLLDEGADVVDIGGESTRPGARVGAENPAVSAEVELQRVLPVITGVKKARPSAIVSIDTYKSTVARDAVEAGAEIVNDVSGLQWDPAMKATLAGLTCGVVLMHTRGRPDEWRSLPTVLDMVMLTNRELRQRSDAAVAGGVKRDRIVLDPGFGFGKRFEENYPLLRRFSEFQELRFPLLAGVSKKSFVGRALAQNGKDATVAGRQFGSLGAEVALAMKGAHIIRTHDVRMCVEALRLADLAAS